MFKNKSPSEMLIKKHVTKLFSKNIFKKTGLFKTKNMTLPFILSACTSGGGGSPSESPTPASIDDVDYVESSDNVFIATSDDDLNLDVSNETQSVVISSAGGDDTIIAGSGDDIIRAGDGADNVKGGDGDDTIVIVGTTTSGQYSSNSITNSAGDADLSSVLDEDDLNNNTVSEVGAGEVIDGGAGNDSLVIYGTAYINQATLRNLDEMWVNSEVILTGEQFSQFGAFKGDGSSVVRVRADYLDSITSSNDDNAGGNKGHGNNTDGQDDNNPGQGSGGPNFRDKDGVDEDENGGGGYGGNDSWDDTPIGGNTNQTPTIVDISDIYMADIGVLSLEGLITLIADDMHDFAGITNVNGDGSTRLVLNGDDDVAITTFDLSEVNLSGIAELDLNGSFNLVVSDANDYFGIGSIAVSNSADITLTIDSTNNSGAIYNFSDSPLLGVDHVRVYGNTTLIFDSVEDFDDTDITSVSGSLTVSFSSDSAIEIDAADLETSLSTVDYIDVGTNATLIFNATEALPSLSSSIITGDGTIEIYRIGVTDEQIETAFSDYLFENTLSITDQNGNDLSSLVSYWGGSQEVVVEPSIITGDAGANVLEGTEGDDTITGLAGDDTLSGNGGNDIFEYLSGDFGTDTITDLSEGDQIDLSGSNWTYGNIKTYYRENSVELHIGTNIIIIENFDGVLTNIGTYNDPILAVMSEEQRLDANHVGDVRPPTINEINVPDVVNLDESIRFYYDIDVSDDVSGVSSTHLKYQADDGSYFYINSYSNSGLEGWGELNEWFLPSTYNLVYAWGNDYENNQFILYEDDIAELGLTSTIEIQNSSPDYLDPNVNSITLDNSVLDLSTDNKIFISLDATDELSGVDYAYLYFTGPTGQQEYVQFTPETGMITELEINEFFGSGTYDLTRIMVRDNAGHQHDYDSAAITEAGLDVSFELINPNGDTAAPNLENLTTNDDQVYVIGVEDQFSLTLNSDEYHSGTDYSQLGFINENGNYANIYIDNTLDSNIAYLDSISADYWQEGTYSLNSVYLKDSADNYHYYYNTDLESENIFFTFEVVAPLKIYGTVENDLLIGGDGYDHFIFGSNFGNDTVEHFTFGEDYIDVSLSNILYADIVQTVNSEGLMLTIGDDSIQINGLTEALDSKYIVGDSETALKEIIFSESVIDITNGGSIDISLNIEDPNFDAYYVRIGIQDPDGNHDYYYLYDDDNFSTTLEFNQWQHSGDFTITSVHIQEPHNTYTDYNINDLTNLGINTSFTVTNDTPDIDMPTLTNFSISSDSVAVGIENVINFTAEGSDATSDISLIQVWYYNPSSTEGRVLNLLPEHQFINGTFFDDWSEVGTYSITQIMVTDLAGNQTLYTKAELEAMGLPNSFEVTDAITDTVAPELTDITLNQPYYDLGNINSDPLIANFSATDDVSGISFVRVYAYEENGSDTTYPYSWNSLNTQFSEQNLVTGIYEIQIAQLKDEAGNYQYYYEADLDTLGINLTFRVLGDGDQPGVDVIGTSGIDTIIGTSDDEVFTLHLGEDTLEIGSDWGHDTILDFIQGDDQIDFSGTGLTFADLDSYDTSYGLFLYDESTGSDLLFQNYFGQLDQGDALFATTHATDGNDNVIAGKLEHLSTGLGNDTIEIIDDQFNQVDGGAGYDTLTINTDQFDGIGEIMDLTPLTQRDAVLNMEEIDLTNGENDAIALTVTDVLSMTDGDNVLVLEGEAGDIFNIAGEGWTTDGTTSQNGSTYNVYGSGDATLLIDQEMVII